MKYEWKKQDKDLYLPKSQPTVIDIPKMHYITIEGEGNPNDDPFISAVQVLYSVSYAVRMLPKKSIIPEGYYEYTVFPLEGVWDLTLEGRALNYLNKNFLTYKLMIRQPNFLTKELFNSILADCKKNKPHPLLDKIAFEQIGEGLCVQALHIGSYDDEPQTFELMEQYCHDHGLIRTSKTHKEVYLSDPRKTALEKFKTVLRFNVHHK